MRRKTTKGLAVAIWTAAVVLCVTGAWFIFSNGRENEVTFEISKWDVVIAQTGQAIYQFTRENGGNLPATLDVVRPAVAAAIPDVLKSDDSGRRVFARTILITDVEDSLRHQHYPWMVAVLVPKHGKIPGDIIIYGTGDKDGFGPLENLDPDRMTQAFGQQVVAGIYRKDREDRANASTRME